MNPAALSVDWPTQSPELQPLGVDSVAAGDKEPTATARSVLFAIQEFSDEIHFEVEG